MQRVKLEWHWIQTLQHFHNPYISNGGWGGDHWRGMSTSQAAKLCSDGPGHIWDQCWTFLPKCTELSIWIFTAPGLLGAPLCPSLTSPLSLGHREENPRCAQVSAKITSATGVQLLSSTSPFLLFWRKALAQTEHEGHHRSSSTPFSAWEPVWCVCTKKGLLWPKFRTWATTEGEGKWNIMKNCFPCCCRWLTG